MQILEALPKRLFWEGPEDLDALVLALLETGVRMTGRKIAGLLGTTDRTIRKSIKRLREKHNIGASIKPPRGYRLKMSGAERETGKNRRQQEATNQVVG